MSGFYEVRPLTDFTIFTTSPTQRKTHQFKASWSTTVDQLQRELEHLKARDVVVEIGVEPKDLRLDGTLRASARPSHPGVRVSFQSKHGPLSYTCDTYERAYGWQMESWQANVRAIVLTLEALRAVDRYGATKGEQYAGFKELGAGSGATPLGGMTRDEAYHVLSQESGMKAGDGTSPNILARIYRGARAAAHPDRHGGDRTRWDQVEQAGRVLGLDR